MSIYTCVYIYIYIYVYVHLSFLLSLSIYIYIYIYTYNLSTPNLPTTIIPTKAARLNYSGKFPLGLRIPSLKT